MARVQESARPAAPTASPQNGEARTSETSPPARRRHVSGVPRPPGVLALAAAGLVVLALGGLYLREQSLFVGTDQATVAGAMVQVGSQAAGVIRSVAVDVGDEVSVGQAVAIVNLPIGASGASQLTVRAPIDGVVVARHGNPGDLTNNGRSVLTLVDPSNLWVEAFIDHGQVSRLRSGQSVDVYVPSLGRSLQGYVTWVGRASVSTASQLARTNSPGSAPSQSAAQAASVPAGASYVPVRIDLDYGNSPLVVGSAVSVRVHL